MGEGEGRTDKYDPAEVRDDLFVNGVKRAKRKLQNRMLAVVRHLACHASLGKVSEK